MNTKPYSRPRAKRWRRGLSAVAAAIAVTTIGVLGAAPAQAAGTPSFYIYFSPGCSGAYRSYSGQNSGEEWINDRFNIGFGTPGYNQLIRYNAASVRVYNAWLSVNYDSNQAWQLPYTVGGTCYDFPSWLRNYNRNWTLYGQ